MNASLRRFAAVAMFGGIVSSVFAEDLAAVEKMIAEKSKAIKAYSSKMTSNMTVDQPGYKMVTISEGTTEMMQKSETVYMMRVETKSKSKMEMGEQKNETETTSLVVGDGTYVWSLQDMGGQKMCTKMKQPPQASPDGLEEQKKNMDFTLLPDEKLDGHDCWVLQGTPKAGSPMAAMAGKMVTHYRKDCGLPVKLVAFGADGKPMMTTTFSDLKLDATFEESRFTYSPPAGVECTEQTIPQTP